MICSNILVSHTNYLHIHGKKHERSWTKTPSRHDYHFKSLSNWKKNIWKVKILHGDPPWRNCLHVPASRRPAWWALWPSTAFQEDGSPERPGSLPREPKRSCNAQGSKARDFYPKTSIWSPWHSAKHTKNLWKITIFNGKTSEMSIFKIKLLVYQRVSHAYPWLNDNYY